MLFWLKKTAALAFFPLTLVLLGGGIGAALLWTRRGQRTGRWLVTAAFLVLFFFSNRGVEYWLVRGLESQYAPVPEAASPRDLPRELVDCRFIVVLGSGHGGPHQWSGVNQLLPSGLTRIAEATRLARLLPGAKLIVSGNTDSWAVTHAQVLEKAARSLGVAPERIIRLDTPRDTHQETLAIARQVGSAPFALVTSAAHLPRAMALCRHLGLHPVPCPAGFILKPDGRGPSWLVWDLDALDCNSKAVYERLGWLWETLRGQI